MSRPKITLGSWEALQEPARLIRQEVFVAEQGIAPELEWDNADASSLHCLIADEHDIPLACGRLLADGHIGRMAVRAAVRGWGLGTLVLNALTESAIERKHARVMLNAQITACGFYQRLGFVIEGEPFQEAGIAHIEMCKFLDQQAPWLMESPPEIHTDRLILRSPVYQDAPTVRRGMQHEAVASCLPFIPCPYQIGDASSWIGQQPRNWLKCQEAEYVIVRRSHQSIIGSFRLDLSGRSKSIGSVGYHIHADHWQQGYATEALKGALDFAFQKTSLHRFDACHLSSNKASGRVMEKAGMTKEGVRRAVHYLDGKWEDEVLWSILKPEWEMQRKRTSV